MVRQKAGITRTRLERLRRWARAGRIPAPQLAEGGSGYPARLTEAARHRRQDAMNQVQGSATNTLTRKGGQATLARGSKYQGVPSSQSGTWAGLPTNTVRSGTTFEASCGRSCFTAMSMP